MVCYGSGEYLPEQALGIQNPHSKKILTAKYNTKKKLRKILKLLKKVLLASFLFGIQVRGYDVYFRFNSQILDLHILSCFYLK